MSIYVIDVLEPDLAVVPKLELVPQVSDAATLSDAELPTPATKIKSARTSRSAASRGTSTRTATRTARSTGVSKAATTAKVAHTTTRATLELVPAPTPVSEPRVDVVARAMEDLATSIGAIEHAALAKFDALIEKLQPAVQRPGRHVAELITFSIKSYVPGRVARHRAESSPDMLQGAF